MTHNNSYEDSDVFVEGQMQEGDCNGTKCYISCSCNSNKGWKDSISGTAGLDYVSKTSQRKYASLGNKAKTCSHACSYTASSSTSCNSGYSTGTTSCSSGYYLATSSCTTTTTYTGSPSGCSKAASKSYPTGGKCNTCTFYESNETCPDGYTLGKTSCDTGYSLTQTDSTITNTRNYGTATECPTYTSSGANRCGKCVQAGCPDGYFETDKSGADCNYSEFRTTVQDKFGYDWNADVCKYNCTKDTNGCYKCEQKYFITKAQCFDSSSLTQWGYSSSYRGLELWVRTNTGGGMANWSWTWSCDTSRCTDDNDDRADPCCSGILQTFSQSDTFGDMTTQPLVIPVSKFAKECSANINSVDGEWWKY